MTDDVHRHDAERQRDAGQVGSFRAEVNGRRLAAATGKRWLE